MGGFFNMFKNIGKSMDAKAQQKADAIEEKNLVEFSKQDIAKMKEDLRSVKGNIGSIKGEIAVLEDQINDLAVRIEKHDNNASALLDAGKDKLAEQNAAQAESLEGEKKALEDALTMQKNLLTKQQDVRTKLESGLREAETSLSTMKAMANVAAANDKLSKVTGDSGTSALASFKERQEKAKKRMIKSEAMASEATDKTLEQETAEALGTSGGSARLARLRAMKNKNSE